MEVINYLISMAEPTGLVRQCFHEELRRSLSHRDCFSRFSHTTFDSTPFLSALIKEIESDGVYDTAVPRPESTQILIQAGFSEQKATELALDVFRATVGVISTIIPDIAFGDTERYQMAIVEGGDVMVSKLPTY